MLGKKPLGLLACLVLLTIAGVAGWSFYSKQLTGIGPAIKPPAEDITKLIDKREVSLELPEGFSLEVFAKGLGDPRVIITDSNKVLIVSLPSKGQVVALPDRDKDGKTDETIVLTKGLNKPHGLALRCVDGKCQLFIAEMNALTVYDYDASTLTLTNRKKLVDLVSGGNHTSRSLLLLPPPNNDKLLVAVGSSCNVCHEQNRQRAKVMVYDLTTDVLKDFAVGLRNSVFQTIHPRTKEIWATEMGRDLLGDDIPPDEINILKEGKNYGWPNCYGQNIHDSDFDKNTYVRNPCMEPFETPALVDLPAHSAPLGLAFINDNDLLVAYHGSWNRSVPTGYKIVRLKFGSNNTYLGSEDFITGWLQSNGTTLGRPVGLLVTKESEIFISDDKSGVIYRIFETRP